MSNPIKNGSWIVLEHQEQFKIILLLMISSRIFVHEQCKNMVKDSSLIF